MNFFRVSFPLFFIALFLSSCSSHKEVVSEKDIPPYATKVNASLNNGDMELVAFYTDPMKPRHGESFKLISFWRLKKQLPAGWKLFYHFEDESGEQRFVIDRPFLDGKVKEPALDKLIKDTAVVKKIPVTFDSSKMLIKTGFFKGKQRTVPDKKYDDGTGRLVAGTVDIDEPSLLKKKMRVYATAIGAIKVDGILKESIWKNASIGAPFWRSRGDKIAPVQTKVMTAMDKNYLYVAFDVTDSDIHAIQNKDDSPMYDTDDVVELYLDANGDRKGYYEIQVSAAGKKFDSSFTGRRRGRNDAWNSNIVYAVHLNGTLNNPKDRDKGWSVEIAVPWKSIVDAPHHPPLDGDVWKAFFYRINRYSDKKATSDDFTAWQPPYAGDFHNIRMMGDLIFTYELIQ